VAQAVSEAADTRQHQVRNFMPASRAAPDFPVQCLGANVPQAWAAGSSFSFLQALCGFTPDAAGGTMGLDPYLPEWLPEISLADFTLGTQDMTLRLQRDGADTRITVLQDPAGLVRHIPRGWGHPGCA
jgi:hypothetical protein